MRRVRGAALIDALIGSLIIGVCIAALVNGWFFRHNVVRRTQHQGVAINLARSTMEEAKQLGFQHAPELPVAKPSLTFYNSRMEPVNADAGDADYLLTLTIVSDRFTTSLPPQPAPTALRHVRVRLTHVPTGDLLYEANNYLVNEGV